MNTPRPVAAWVTFPSILIALASVGGGAPEQSDRNDITVEAVERVIEVSTDGGSRWIRIQANQVLKTGDRLRTGPNSRASLRLSPATVISFGSLTEIEILPPEAAGMEPGLHFFRGILSFFHKGRPGRIRVISPGGAAGIDGTEFVMIVDSNRTEHTTLALIDGIVRFGNERKTLRMFSGDQAILEAGGEPVRIAGFIANNLLQWAFYYPAVLDPQELPLSPEEEGALKPSLAAYRSGNLLAALDEYGARNPKSEAEQLYRAALLLAVGEAGQTADALAQLEREDVSERGRKIVAALRQQIAATKRQSVTITNEPRLTTELLAASYYEQSLARGDETLKRALILARQAATHSPDFGFAWARVAELEFSFGRIGNAKEALDKSLALSPSNAQAVALGGFLLAAQNKAREAIEWFDRALAIDSALGNAWLGRGLCRIRHGDSRGGRTDLLMAAALEPRRAEFRSYLGKAYSDTAEVDRALHELDLAKNIDPNDPTAWFYSALAKANQNRMNEAIRDLERSQQLNDNRRVNRSEFRLDQDRAVRSANLAQLYADANLIDVAVREAGRGVVTDYSDYSAHLFLANSYENERRAGLSTLRLEAAAVSESLLARLLGPPSGYLLAQPVPQLDSTKLLERDGLGLTANTEFFSRGAWRHTSAQYGTLQNSSYSLNAEYLAEPGERRNQDFEIQLLEARIKQNITPRDSVLLEVLDYRSNGGDTLQHFDEANVSPEFRFDEKQNPRLLAGYHHEWSAQSHTLLLVGRVADTLETENPFFDFIARDFPGNKSVVSVPARDDFRNRVEVYTAEVQQIATFGRQSVIAGARLEYTEENVANVVSHPQPDDDKPLLGEQEPVSAQNLRATAYTTTLYVYDYVTLTEALRAMAGLAFTDQEIPVNTDIPPITSDREEQEQVSPKAGIVWSPKPWFNLRGGYTRSMIGSGLSQSMRLEPTHVAGLVQTFRNVVPRGSVASLDGADLDTAEIVWDAHLPDTYFSAGYQWLNTDRTRREGLFLAYPDPYRIFPPSRSLIREKIDFNEQVLELSARRLVSKEWSLGARYRLAYDKLEQNFPDYSEDRFTDVHLAKRSQSKAWLHTIELSVLYRHQSGWFGQIDGTWFSQEREHDAVDLRADDFWQLNVKAGYRFPRQRAEITVGVLNLLDSDYQLDPLNAHPDLPRSRTLYVRLLLNF